MPFTLVPPDAEQPAAAMPGSFTLVPPAVSPVSNPADDFGPGQRFVQGYGATVADRLLGLKTLMAQAQSRGVTDLLAQDPSGFNAFQEPTDTRAAGAEWLKQLHGEAAAKKVTDAPLRETTAGTLGGVGSDVMSLLATGGSSLLGAFGSNAALGALEPTDEGDSIAWNALKSGVLGMGGKVVADAFGAILRGVKPTDEQIKAAQAFADKWGGTLSRGQMAGSEMLQRMERMAAAVGSKFFKNADEANAGAVKRAINSVTGGDAGAMYKGLGDYGFTVDHQLAKVAREAGSDFASLPTAQQPRTALDALDELFRGTPGSPNPQLAGFGPAARAQAVKAGVPETVGGVPAKLPEGTTIPMVGERGDFNNLQNIRSLYAKLAFKNDPDSAVYTKLVDALDDAADRNLVKQGLDEGTMSGIRRAYSVEKITRPAAIVNEAGEVTGYDTKKLAQIVKQLEAKSPERLNRMGDAGQLLRDAAAFGRVAKPANSSGTAENQIAGKIMGLEMIKDAANAVLHGGNVFTAMMQGIAPLTGAVYTPRLVNALMQATRNGVLPEAKSEFGRRAADATARIGTSAARALPLSLSLGDLLPAAGTPQ